MAHRIIAGNDFRLIVCAKRSMGAYLTDMDLSEVDSLRIYMTRAGRSKELQSYTLDENGNAVIYVAAQQVSPGIYGIEMVGVYGDASLRAHLTTAFQIVGAGHGDAGVLTDYSVDIVFAINVAASDVFVKASIEAHNTDQEAHQDIRALIASTRSDLEQAIEEGGADVSAELENLQDQIDAIIAGSASASITASKTTVFKGVSTAITLLAKCSPAAETITIKKGNTVINTGTGGSLQATVNVDTQADVTYTAEFTMSGGTRTAEVKIKAVSPIFFGAGLDESDITSQASVRSSVAGTYTINVPSNNMYIFFIIPASMTQIKSAAEGPITFPLSDPPTDTTRVVEGTTVNYKVYQSNSLLAGDYTITLT